MALPHCHQLKIELVYKHHAISDLMTTTNLTNAQFVTNEIHMVRYSTDWESPMMKAQRQCQQWLTLNSSFDFRFPQVKTPPIPILNDILLQLVPNYRSHTWLMQFNFSIHLTSNLKKAIKPNLLHDPTTQLSLKNPQKSFHF